MRDLIQKIDRILNESVEEDNGLFQIGDEFGISFSEDLEIATTIVGFVEDGIVVELDDEAIGIMESHGARFVEGYLEEGLRDPKDNPCWKGYHPVGTKKKNGKTVPNCVPKESVAEGSGMNVVKSVKVGNFRHDLVDTGFGWQVRIYIGDQLYDAGLSKNSEQKGLAALDDYVAYTKKQLRIQDDGVAEAEYQGKDVPLGKKLPGDVKKYKVYVKNPKGNVVKVNFGDKKMRIKKSNPERRKSFRARHNCDNPGQRTSARYWSCRNW